MFDILDVLASYFREVACGGGYAQRIQPQLKHADDLIGAVLAA